MTTNTSTEKPAAPMLTITHVFDAPRELVWEMWTKAEHFAQWWGPDLTTVPVCEMDVRVGGAIHLVMEGADGAQQVMNSVFKEVQAPERISFLTKPVDAEGNVLFEALETAVFTQEGTKTLLTLTEEIISKTPAANEFLPYMEAGATQSLAKLQRVLEDIVKTSATP